MFPIARCHAMVIATDISRQYQSVTDYACMVDRLHIDDVAAMLSEKGLGLDKRSLREKIKSPKLLIQIELVEAAGVEPASEIIVSRENPCSVRFRRVRLMHSERTRCA